MSSSIPDNTIYDVVHTSSARTLEGAFERFGNLLDAALSASTDHHAVVNREGVLLYVSLVCAHSLGQERAELIGKSISVLGYPAEATERLHLEIDTVFTRGEALSGSTETQIRDGVRVIEYALTPVFDTEGDVEAALLRARAVVREENRTASVEDALSQSVERFRILAEAMPQFVWVSDAEGRVEYVNRRWTEYTGQSVEQTGPQDDSMIHPEDASIMWERWNEAKATGADYEVEFRCRRFSDGAFRWFLARGVPLKDAQGRVIRWIGTSTDIDAQKQAEAQVSLLNNRLHRAVYESSHRIKNQLQILAATVDMALMDGDALIPADALRRLGTQIRTLSVLQDILTLEWKADATGAVETVSVKAMLERVLEALRQTSERHQVAFLIAEAALPMSAATALALITNEAAANAIKHGTRSVEVLFEAVGETGALQVCDDGPGFREGFDPTTEANTGLELISLLAVHDLNGVVRYENRPEGGARVIVTFPLSGRFPQ